MRKRADMQEVHNKVILHIHFVSNSLKKKESIVISVGPVGPNTVPSKTSNAIQIAFVLYAMSISLGVMKV